MKLTVHLVSSTASNILTPMQKEIIQSPVSLNSITNLPQKKRSLEQNYNTTDYSLVTIPLSPVWILDITTEQNLMPL